MKSISSKFLLLIVFWFNNSSYASDNHLIPEVFQREYIFTSDYNHPQVQTYSLVTCVALSIYDLNSRTGVLAHIDAKTRTKDVKYLFSLFRGNTRLRIELHGGVAGSKYNLMPQLNKTIRDLGYRVHSFSQNISSSHAMAVMLNLKTGTVSKYDETYTNTNYIDYLAKLKRMKLSRRLYRHLDSLGGGDQLQLDRVPDFDIENQLRFIFSN